MKPWNVLVIAVLAAAIVLPCAAFAEDDATTENLLPAGTVFHLDPRWVTIFDLGIFTVDQDKQVDQTTTTVNAGGVLGSSLYGMKLGWLINGHHDVGLHVLAGLTDTLVRIDPEAQGVESTNVHTTGGNYRAALYYNYNWHANNWVMPYLGPLVGVQGEVDRVVYEESDGDNYTRNLFGPFGGLEVGVKLFPYKHVAFDIGAMGSYGAGAQQVDYDADKTVDDDGVTGKLNVGAYAGLNIYFGKTGAPKPCPECPQCPEIPQPVAVPKLTTFTVVVTDKCTGAPIAATVAVGGMNYFNPVKQEIAGGNATLAVSAEGYDAKQVATLIAPATENVVNVALFKHIQLTDAVYFASGKATILPKSYAVLDDVVMQIQGMCEFDKIMVEGHTDSVGQAQMNKALSQRRAESVLAYLVSKGIDANKLQAIGYGEDKPIATNDTAQGKAQNRRVEFKIE
ncbi:MAG: OmpA family protein [Candidatus Alcyoniella australis]|nr:OmpA family protein [Candidatus Alcyoniella australis]